MAVTVNNRSIVLGAAGDIYNAPVLVQALAAVSSTGTGSVTVAEADGKTIAQSAVLVAGQRDELLSTAPCWFGSLKAQALPANVTIVATIK